MMFMRIRRSVLACRKMFITIRSRIIIGRNKVKRNISTEMFTRTIRRMRICQEDVHDEK
jgi:hypothetical protein